MTDSSNNKPLLEITMLDVAIKAGVSVSTVSRALAGSSTVSDATRNRVLTAARSLNYVLNVNARNLRNRRNRTVEVLIPLAEQGRQHMSDPFYLDMLGALADALSEQHYDLLLTTQAPWAKGVETCSLQSGRADGMIIMGQGQDLAALRHFTSLHSQIVTWGGHLAGDEYVVVGTDNVYGGVLATSHLINLGRKRIAFLGDPAEPELALRQQGYSQALMAAGRSIEPTLIFKAPYDAKEAKLAAREMLKSGVTFDAVFCGSDVIAMSAITEFRNAGYRIPEDIAVVGYDDITMAANFGPAITTVSQHIRQGGFLMVQLLMDIFQGKPIATKLLPAELIVRHSCGSKKLEKPMSAG